MTYYLPTLLHFLSTSHLKRFCFVLYNLSGTKSGIGINCGSRSSRVKTSKAAPNLINLDMILFVASYSNLYLWYTCGVSLPRFYPRSRPYTRWNFLLLWSLGSPGLGFNSCELKDQGSTLGKSYGYVVILLDSLEVFIDFYCIVNM